MSSTVTRFNWTDDTGNAANPNGDGTIIDDAQLQLIFDAVDDLFTGELVAGRLTAESHSSGVAIKADVANNAGAIIGRVRNTQAGTAASASVDVGNDGSATAGRLRATSSTFTAGSGYLQNAVHLHSALAGGLKLFCDHASGFTMLGRRVALDPNSPATLGSNQTDYALGGTDAVVYFINTSVGGVRIDGIAGGFAGRMIWIVYVGGHTLTIGYNTGSAPNKVFVAAAADVVMSPFSVAPFFHDGTNWFMGAKS